jgi:hypothetical protein
MNNVIDFLEEELRQANIELNTLTGELCLAQNSKVKVTPWRDARDRCRTRIARMETFLASIRGQR